MVFRSFRRYQRPLLIGVTVFVLLTFSITGAVITAFSPSAKAEMARFTLPSGRDVVVGRDLYHEFAAMLGAVGGLAPQPWTAGENRRLEREDVLAFLMLYFLAEDLGLDVGPSGVGDALQRFFKSQQTYRDFLKARGWRSGAFEEWMRRILLVDRYRSFLVSAYAVPTPEEIEAEWKERNALLTVEAVAFAPSAYEEAVGAKEPTEEDLTALAAGLTPVEQGRFRRPERLVLEGLSLEVSEALPEKLATLLEGEPEPSTEDLLAFYKRYESRYPSTSPESETRPAEAPGAPLPFEEVEDRVRREIRFKRAMDKILALARAPEAPPLQALAEEWGLETFSHGLSDRKAIEAIPRFSDAREVDACFDPLGAPEGGWVSRPLFSPLSTFLVRVVRRVPAGLANLQDDRADFVELWRARQKVSEAKGAAQAFREAVDAAVAAGEASEAAFPREAEARSVEVQRFGPFPLGARLEPGFFDQPAGLEKYLKSRVDFYEGLEPGALVGPEAQGADEAFVVARLVAREDPDPSTMKPKEVREAFHAVAIERRQRIFEDADGWFERLSNALGFRWSEPEG